MNRLILFLAGLLWANGIPHFVNGISGRRFHSPFAKPFVKGRSSALSNVLWGLANFAAGIALLGTMRLTPGLNPDFVAFACGFGVTAVGLAVFFERLDSKK